MSLTWNTVIRQAAVKINALGTAAATPAATAASLQTVYATVPLTVVNFASSIFSFGAIKDACINAESGLVNAIANSANHPWREVLTSQTSALAYGDSIPSTDSGGTNQIIGMRGSVIDSDSGEPCTENQLEQIRDRVVNPNSMWLTTVYWYAINDARIYHTLDSVVIDVCTYTRPSSDALSLTANVTLPDVLAPAYVDGALMELVRDDEFMAQGEKFGGIYNAWLGAIQQGLTSVNPATMIAQSQVKGAASAV